MRRLILLCVAWACAASVTDDILALRDGEPAATREAAARALWAHAYDAPGNAEEIVGAGGVRPLVALLKADAGDALNEGAAGALMDVCLANDSHKLAIVKAGALAPCLALISAPGASDAAREAALGLLLQLQKVARFGVIGPLVKLVSSGDPPSRRHACWALSRLADLGASVALSIARAHAVMPLVARVRTAADSECEECADAATALWNLAHSNAEAAREIVEADAAAALILLLHVGRGAAELEAAAGALASLGPLLRDEVQRRGALELFGRLVTLLRHDNTNVRRQAARALYVFSLDDVHKVPTGFCVNVPGEILRGAAESHPGGTLLRPRHLAAQVDIALHAGAMTPLERVVAQGDEEARQFAAAALRNIGAEVEPDRPPPQRGIVQRLNRAFHVDQRPARPKWTWSDVVHASPRTYALARFCFYMLIARGLWWCFRRFWLCFLALVSRAALAAYAMWPTGKRARQEASKIKPLRTLLPLLQALLRLLLRTADAAAAAQPKSPQSTPAPRHEPRRPAAAGAAATSSAAAASAAAASAAAASAAAVRAAAAKVRQSALAGDVAALRLELTHERTAHLNERNAHATERAAHVAERAAHAATIQRLAEEEAKRCAAEAAHAATKEAHATAEKNRAISEAAYAKAEAAHAAALRPPPLELPAPAAAPAPAPAPPTAATWNPTWGDPFSDPFSSFRHDLDASRPLSPPAYPASHSLFSEMPYRPRGRSVDQWEAPGLGGARPRLPLTPDHERPTNETRSTTADAHRRNPTSPLDKRLGPRGPRA